MRKLAVKGMGLAMGLIMAGAVAVAADTTGAGMSRGSGQQMGAAGAKELHQHMMQGANEMRSMQMTGDVDHDFVMAMKKHHQHGIEMAKIAVRHGKDAQAKAFAQKLIDDQQRDIAELDRWLSQHGHGK